MRAHLTHVLLHTDSLAPLNLLGETSGMENDLTDMGTNAGKETKFWSAPGQRWQLRGRRFRLALCVLFLALMNVFYRMLCNESVN